MKKLIYLCLLTICLLNLTTKRAHAIGGVGDIVFDATAAEHAVTTIENQISQLQQAKELVENVGKGNFTPDAVSFIGTWYKNCGGSRFALPDWFPSLSVKICGNQVSIFNSVADDYKKNYIPISTDDMKTRAKKEKNYQEAGKKIKVFALTRSAITLRSVSENQNSLDSLQTSLKSASNQVAVMKVQAQATIQLVAQLQELNQQLASLTQVEAFK